MLNRFLLASALALFSFSAFSQVKWIDISKDSKLRFTQEIKLETIGEEKSFVIPTGSQIKVSERVSLSMINVEMFKVVLTNCSDTSARGEMQLFDVDQTNGKVVTAGVELTGDCNLEIFIEARDLYSRSFLK